MKKKIEDGHGLWAFGNWIGLIDDFDLKIEIWFWEVDEKLLFGSFCWGYKKLIFENFLGIF